MQPPIKDQAQPINKEQPSNHPISTSPEPPKSSKNPSKLIIICAIAATVISGGIIGMMALISNTKNNSISNNSNSDTNNSSNSQDNTSNNTDDSTNGNNNSTNYTDEFTHLHGYETDLTKVPDDTNLDTFQITSDVASQSEQAEILNLFKTTYEWRNTANARYIGPFISGDTTINFSDNATIATIACTETYFSDEKNITEIPEGTYKDTQGNEYRKGMHIIKAQLLLNFTLEYFNKKINFDKTYGESIDAYGNSNYLCPYIPELDAVAVGGWGGGMPPHATQFNSPAIINKSDNQYLLTADFATFIGYDNDTIYKRNGTIELYFDKVVRNNKTEFVIAKVINTLK